MGQISKSMSGRMANPLFLEVGCGQSRRHTVQLDFSSGTAANAIGDSANIPFCDV